MLKAVIGLGVVTLLFVLAVIYVPSFASLIPQADVVRAVAAPLAVLVSLAALFAWRPSDSAD